MCVCVHVCVSLTFSPYGRDRIDGMIDVGEEACGERKGHIMKEENDKLRREGRRAANTKSGPGHAARDKCTWQRSKVQKRQKRVGLTRRAKKRWRGNEEKDLRDKGKRRTGMVYCVDFRSLHSSARDNTLMVR